MGASRASGWGFNKWCGDRVCRDLFGAAGMMPSPDTLDCLLHAALSHQRMGGKCEERIRERGGFGKGPLIANIWRNPGDVREVGTVEP